MQKITALKHMHILKVFLHKNPAHRCTSDDMQSWHVRALYVNPLAMSQQSKQWQQRACLWQTYSGTRRRPST